MAKNDPLKPQLARASQDVEPPAHREPEGVFHVGRGGAANVGKPSEEEAQQAKARNQQRRKSVTRWTSNEDVKGWAEKGKDILKKKIADPKQ